MLRGNFEKGQEAYPMTYGWLAAVPMVRPVP